MSDAAADAATVVLRREGAVGAVLMNRPRALNALDLGMIRALQQALDACRDDEAVKLVLLEGAGGKAFCAGGDVRGIRDLATAGDAASIETFFSEEYALNRGIARFPKPWVSFIDGVCMGGGIGVSVHNGPQDRHRERPAGDAGDGDRLLPGRRDLLCPAAPAGAGSACGWR